jgi:hypothetical protein
MPLLSTLALQGVKVGLKLWHGLCFEYIGPFSQLWVGLNRLLGSGRGAKIHFIPFRAL